MTHLTTTDFPNWATRSNRAVPKMPVPRLRTLDTDVLEDLRPVAIALIARPVLGAAAFVVAAIAGWWWAVLPIVWLIYGSTIAAVHQLIHSSLGLSHRARTFWLTTLGMLVAESGHALQTTHLMHHRTDPTLPDPEGYIENVTWREMPIAAIKFRYRLALWGWHYAPRRGLIGIELGAHAVLHIASLALLPITPWVWVYLTLIHLASFAFAVLAGKGPQTNWGREIASPLVRVHTRLGKIVFFSHDQHLEHHAYPKVPLARLRRLHPHIDPALAGEHIVDVRMAL